MVLEDNGRAVIYERDSVVYGCLRSAGTRKMIFGMGTDDRVEASAVAGGYAAVVSQYRDRYNAAAAPELGSLYVVRLDRPGRRRVRFDNRGQQRVSDLILRATGDAGMITVARRSRAYVWRVEGRERTLLDSGTAIRSGSLRRLSRDRIAWRSGTKLRTARLGPAG